MYSSVSNETPWTNSSRPPSSFSSSFFLLVPATWTNSSLSDFSSESSLSLESSDDEAAFLAAGFFVGAFLAELSDELSDESDSDATLPFFWGTEADDVF